MPKHPTEKPGKGVDKNPGAFDGGIEGYPGSDDPEERFTRDNIVNVVVTGLEELRQGLTEMRADDGVDTAGADAKAFESDYGPEGGDEGDEPGQGGEGPVY